MIKNAQIDSTMLGWEDHGILTCSLVLNYGGSCQGFGGFAFDEPISKDGKFSHRQGTDFGMQFIEGVMRAVGASSWEKLKGMHCRVETDAQDDWGGHVIRIGHFMKDQWFDPEELRKRFRLPA